MKMISLKRVILFTLATSMFLASKTICLNEPLTSNFQSREEYSDDNYPESSEDIIEEKQRNLNLEELKDWELKNIIKMSTPAMKKIWYFQQPCEKGIQCRRGKPLEDIESISFLNY